MLGRNRGGPREDLGRVAVVMILEVVVEDIMSQNCQGLGNQPTVPGLLELQRA